MDVIGIGEVCIDWTAKVKRLPEPDEKIFAEDYQLFVGGVTANFLTALSKLGGNVGFIGGVGKDQYGDMIIDALTRQGIDLSNLIRYEENRTAVNFVIVDEKGEKAIIQDKYLMENVPPPEFIDEKYIVSAKAIHTTAIKVSSALKGFEIAKKYDLTTSFDLEKHVAEYGLDSLKPILKLTDILMPNKLGIRSLTGEEDLVKAARKMLKLGPQIVVITLGSRGSMVVLKDDVIKVPAFKVNVVDTTGAGDEFNAAFIYGLVIRGWDYYKSSLFANAAAAIKCTKLGAQTGQPKYDEVIEFLRERGFNYG